MPHITRRALLHSLAVLGCAAARPALAETYPTKPVRVIIPFGPGGVGDITIRIVAEKLSDKLGRRFIIENMPSPDGIFRSTSTRTSRRSRWSASSTA